MEDKKKSNKKTGWGGARPGSGRPKGDKELFALRIGGEAAKMIKCQPNRSDFICDCIREHMEREAEQLPDLPMVGLKPEEIASYNVRVACGQPIGVPEGEKPEMIDLRNLVCLHEDSSMLFKVTGESMIKVGILPGDTVVVDWSMRTPIAGKIMLCQVDGDYTLKYVEVHDDAVWLVPANDTMEPIKVNRGQQFRIVGMMTGLTRRY